MKYIAAVVIVFAFTGCSEEGPPTGPVGTTETRIDPPPLAPYYMDFSGYGESVEPGFIKVYSDGAWDKYAGVQIVKDRTYKTIVCADSSTHYYMEATGQYAGFREKGKNVVLFDVPMGTLPTRWRSDTTVTLSATFTQSGARVALVTSYVLADTGSLTTPVGAFSAVAHFRIHVSISSSVGGGYSISRESWVARGPGGVVMRQAEGASIYFVRGSVNGRSWGSPSGAQGPAGESALSAPVVARGLLRTVLPD
jgi:hypothetical protein